MIVLVLLIWIAIVIKGMYFLVQLPETGLSHEKNPH
jgi:hypothetical protein